MVTGFYVRAFLYEYFIYISDFGKSGVLLEDPKILLMGRFIILFFCSILSIGNIETTTSNEEYAWQMNNNGRGPILKEQVFLVQGYQNIQGIKSEQGNSPTESCFKHDKSPEIPILPSASRRSFSSQNQRNPWTKFVPTNVPPQVLGYEDNKSRLSNNEETYSPQLFNNEDRVAANQYTLQEINPTSNEDHIEDSVIEKTSALYDTTTLVNEIPPNQEIGQELEIEESRNINSDVTEEQLSLTPTVVESSIHQNEAGCSKKHDFDSSAIPPRRVLVSNPQKNIIGHNNHERTNKVVKIYSLPTLKLHPNVNGKARDLLGSNNINNLPQQNIEEGRADNANNMYTGNNYNNLQDPAKGEGISYMNKNTMKFTDYDRVCYACSSAYNPTCLSPDRKTTVKYCRKGVNACVTKTFGTGSTLTLIRDCGKTCNDAKIPSLLPNYKTCSICHTDLCNGSYSINVYSSILALPTIALIILGKPLLGFG